MPENQAAWLTSYASKLEVKSAPYTAPGSDEVVVKNGAVAVNPLDWSVQDAGDVIFRWVKTPFILGSDVAGEVVEVGSNVTRFKVGDRVLGHAVAFDQRSNRTSEGGFQHYTVLRTNLTSHIPDSIPYEKATVLPLALSTAACGLFMEDYLNLKLPKVSPEPAGQTLLVWGGSSSVGSNAIQLARAAGYDVIATASPRNHEYLRTLGASEVFDYRSPTVTSDIIAALKGKTVAGAFAVGAGSLAHSINVLANSNGKKFIAQVSADLPPSGFPSSKLGWAPFGIRMVIKNTANTIRSLRGGVKSKFIWGSDLMANHIGDAIYKDFLPEALKEGKYIPAPEPFIVGKGLEHVEEGIQLNRKGVSAKKIVITL